MDRKKQKTISVQGYVQFWRNLYPEIKPLPSTIRFWENKIKEVLKKNKNPRALVLGATPEIRDLLAKYKVKTICLDINPMMIKAMAQLIKKRNPKEKVVVGNWLKMPFPKNTFDLVLSDCPQDNLPYQKWNIFFRNVYRILKPGGYWLLGATFFQGFQEGINLQQFIKIYRQNPKRFRNPSWKCYYLLKLTCTRDFYNDKTKIGDWIKLDKKIEHLYKSGQINEREFNDLRMSTNQLGQSLSCQFTWVTQDEFYKFLKKHHFSILGYRGDDVFPAGQFRWAYILKKK